jgi:hypothetical protein
MRTFNCKDVSEHKNYHPIFKLVLIDEGPLPVCPKVGDIVSQWDIEALIYNGNRVVLEPRDAS